MLMNYFRYIIEGEGAVSSKALEVIADKIADMRRRGEVTSDDVRKASSFIHPDIRVKDFEKPANR